MKPNWNDKSWRDDILHVMDRLCRYIWKVDLLQDQAVTLWDAARQETGGAPFRWSEYLEGEGGIIFTSLGHAAEHVTCEALRRANQEGENSLEYAMTRSDKRDLILLFSQEEALWAYILILREREDDLLREIVNLYVYNNCDYFIYLDARRNSYVMFSGSQGSTPLPPAFCQDYSTEIVKYADAFVVPKDREMVVREMSLPRVLRQLDEKGVHIFYAGVMDPVLGYTRKKLEYRYYDRKTGMILLSRTDVTAVYLEEEQRRQELQEALRQAHTDALTGLLNYQGLRSQVSAALAASRGSSSLLFLDLDNFKQINDTYGHPAGDDFLRQVAGVLEEETRENDLAGRVGGDEYIIYLSGIRSREAAQRVAQRICARCGLLSYRQETAAAVSCSVGVAMSPEDGNDYDTLVKAADERAYRAKSMGKNQVCAR